jgi:Bifunctional DNA primase/polymerase, N-terminal/Protein of unknown function (DUF2637)
MSALLDAALVYAARGIPVYPVHWPRPTPGGTSLACSCPRGALCDRPAKHPLVRHGGNDATTEPGQVKRWWQHWPQANLGLATGVVFDALDVDGPAGLAALRQLQGATGLRLPGPLVRTGGGGWHAWFRPTGLGNRPPRSLDHVDWRGRGGAVLAPPSRHASGGTYRWLRDLDHAPLPEVPAALRALLDPDPPAMTRPAALVGPAAAGHPYDRRVLAAELAALGRATPGHRNHTLNRTAFKVYRYVAGGVLDEEHVTLAFTTAALALGLDRAEIGRTLASARTAGLANPRTVPTRPQPRGGRVMTGRWTYRTSAAGVLMLAAAAFTLSYDALHQLALDSRVRPALAWLWPVVIDGTIVVALLTVLAANRAARKAGYPWALAGLFSAASVAFNIAHAPDRPVAQLVFAMAPVALVLTTHLLLQQVGWRRSTPGRPTEPVPDQQAEPDPAHPHRPGDHPAPEPPSPDQPTPAGARARVRAAYEAQIQAGQTPTGAGLARAAGVSERYGQRLLAEFTADPARPGHPNGNRPAEGHPAHPDAEGR